MAAASPLTLARRPAMALLALPLLAFGAWLWWPAGGNALDDAKPLDGPALTALAAPVADRPLELHLRSMVPESTPAWRQLPPAGRTLWAGIACEQVDMGITWPVAIGWDATDSGAATLAEAGDAYELLDLPLAASAVRDLEALLDADRQQLRDWQQRDGRAPDLRRYARPLTAWHAQLPAIRTARLAFARANADELGIK